MQGRFKNTVIERQHPLEAGLYLRESDQDIYNTVMGGIDTTDFLLGKLKVINAHDSLGLNNARVWMNLWHHNARMYQNW